MNPCHPYLTDEQFHDARIAGAKKAEVASQAELQDIGAKIREFRLAHPVMDDEAFAALQALERERLGSMVGLAVVQNIVDDTVIEALLTAKEGKEDPNA